VIRDIICLDNNKKKGRDLLYQKLLKMEEPTVVVEVLQVEEITQLY